MHYCIKIHYFLHNWSLTSNAINCCANYKTHCDCCLLQCYSLVRVVTGLTFLVMKSPVWILPSSAGQMHKAQYPSNVSIYSQWKLEGKRSLERCNATLALCWCVSFPTRNWGRGAAEILAVYAWSYLTAGLHNSNLCNVCVWYFLFFLMSQLCNDFVGFSVSQMSKHGPCSVMPHHSMCFNDCWQSWFKTVRGVVRFKNFKIDVGEAFQHHHENIQSSLFTSIKVRCGVCSGRIRRG